MTTNQARIETFTAPAIDFDKIFADIVIMPSKTKQITVILVGDEQMRSSVNLAITGETLYIRASIPLADKKQTIDTYFWFRPETFSKKKDQLHIDNHPVDTQKKLSITVIMPPETSLKTREGVIGSVTVTESQGDLILRNSGGAKIHVQKGKNFHINNSGNGTILIDEVFGWLDVIADDKATVSVLSGKPTKVGITTMGDAKVQVKSASGNCHITASSNASVVISSGETEYLLASCSNNGNIHFGGIAKTANLTATESGKIFVQKCIARPKATRSNLGTITVNQILRD